MNNELIGKYYKKKGELFDSYVKITGELNVKTMLGEDCLVSQVFFNKDAEGAATITVNNPNTISWIKQHYTKISHEEFLAAYDKALNIINEYRKQL